MKNILSLFTFLFIGFSVFAQIERDLGPFNSIKVSDKIDLRLILSDENRIEISGEKSEDVVVNNQNGNLKIRMKTTELLQGNDIIAQLYYKNIDEIVANSGSLVSSDEILTAQSLKLRANQGSEIDLKVEVKKLDITTNSGGQITLAGSTELQEIVSNSGGFYDGENLKSLHTKVTVNAGGKADIYASETAEAKTRAGGEIHIWGGAEVNEKRFAGGTVNIH